MSQKTRVKGVRVFLNRGSSQQNVSAAVIMTVSLIVVGIPVVIVVGSVAVIKGIPGFAEGLVWIILLPHGLELSNALPDNYGLAATGKALVFNTLCESAASTVQFVPGWVLVLKSRKLALKALDL